MKTLTALPVFLALGPAIASAEPVDPFSEPEEWDLFRAEANLVTVASRYKQTTREAPAVVEVIDQQDIRRMGYRTLADVLQSLSGIFMSQSPEGYQLAWIRGVIQSDNNKILLMIDGVPTYDGFYTHAWLDAYLPLDHVRQIEVIKGPGSAIYGTNAFAGVINVVTMGAESLEGGVFRASGGSFGTRSAMAMAGAQVDDKRFNASWSAYARVFESDGDGVERTPRGKRDVQGLRPISASNAGFKVNWNNMHLRWDHVSYSAAYLTQPQSNIWEVLLESPDEFNLGFRNDFVYADMDLNLGSEIRLTPWALFQDHDNPGLYGWITPPETTQDPDTGDITTEWSGTLVETEKHTRRYGAGTNFEARPVYSHIIVAGAGLEAIQVVEVEDRYFEDFKSAPVDPSPFRVPEGSWVGGVHAFLQHSWTPLYWVKFNAGARLDYITTTETLFPSPRLGFLLVPSTQFSTKVLYGRAFRAPNVRELLVEVAKEEDGSYKFTASNKELLPESIDTIEGEITWTPNSTFTLRSVAFGSILANTITKSGNPNQYINRGGARVVGTELDLTAHVGPVSLRGTYAYTWGRDNETGYAIYGVPPHSGHARMGVELTESLYATTEWDFFSRQPRTEWAPDSGATDGIGFYVGHVGISSDYGSDDRVRFNASVRNILDSAAPSLVYLERANAMSNGVRKYPNDIEREGRSFRVSVDVRF